MGLVIAGMQIIPRIRKKPKVSIPPVEDSLLKMMSEQQRTEQKGELIIEYERAADMKDRYKYSSHTTLHSPSGTVRYWLCWDGGDTPCHINLYYKGLKYTLERDNGILTFLYGDYVPKSIPSELLNTLPDIQERFDEFWRYEYPEHPYWNYQTLMQLIQQNDIEHNVHSSINLLMFCWHFDTEIKIEKTLPVYESILSDYFDDWERYAYKEEPLFLFTMGWMLRIHPLLWGVDDKGETGKAYLLKAHQLAPENPLYKWAVSDQLNLSREEKRTLAAQVDASQFDGLEPFIKEYFIKRVFHRDTAG